MIELLFTAGLWFSVFVFVYCACLVITCAAQEVRNVPRDLSLLTIHDWDAPGRAMRNAQRLESWQS